MDNDNNPFSAFADFESFLKDGGFENVANDFAREARASQWTEEALTDALAALGSCPAREQIDAIIASLYDAPRAVRRKLLRILKSAFKGKPKLMVLEEIERRKSHHDYVHSDPDELIDAIN